MWMWLDNEVYFINLEVNIFFKDDLTMIKERK